MEQHQFEQIEEIPRADVPSFTTSVDQNFASLFSQLFGTETSWPIEATQLPPEPVDFSRSTDDFLGPAVSSNSLPVEYSNTLFPWSHNLPFVTSEGETFVTSGCPISAQAAQILSLQTSQLSVEPGSGVPFTCDFLTPVRGSRESFSTVFPSVNENVSTQYHPSVKIHELSGRSDDQHRELGTKKR